MIQQSTMTSGGGAGYSMHERRVEDDPAGREARRGAEHASTLTKPGVRGLRRNPVIRMLADIRFGITMMALVLIYASVASALPQVRGALEMSEMEIFRHWLFATLCGLLALSLIVATLTRIPFKSINAGVLTVHTGLLLLIGGSVVYFSSKVEGDVLLRSPRVELIANVGGDLRVIGQLIAEPHSEWRNVMPAFGGDVALEVVDTDHDEMGALRRATVQAQLAGADPIRIGLDANGDPMPVADGRLQVRLTSFPAVSDFYDSEAPTIYVRDGATGERTALPIEGLPLFRERYTDEGYVLRDADGNPVPSKRRTPQVTVAGRQIPTGWLEHWRMPIALKASGLPFDVEVTGFVPYIADMESVAVGGGGATNPAIRLAFSAGAKKREFSLFALDPKESLLMASMPVEFRWAEDAAARDDMLRDLAGPHELTIEVKDPPVKKTLAIRAGQVIPIEGTDYELTIKNLTPSWPLMTPGFENAVSPMASVDVTNGSLSYNRTVIQRFPNLSQDIDAQGVRHREGPYDPNLVLNYRTAASGWMTIVAMPDAPLTLGLFDSRGRVRRTELPVGAPKTIDLGGASIDMTVANYFPDGRRMQIPVIEPIDRRRPNIAAHSMSAVRLQFTGRDAYDGWSESRWCMFSQYPHVDTRPIAVQTPDGRDWEIVYSRLARDLGVEIAARKLSVEFFPGRQNVESWRSDFVMRETPGGALKPAAVYTNETCSAGPWTLFQSGAAQDHWSFTILGVGNRRGIVPMVAGCVLITLGCLFAFYVKPVLKKRAARSP